RPFHRVATLLAGTYPLHPDPRVRRGPEPLQIPGQRVPQCLGEGRGRYVEDQPLGRAQEVHMEHDRHLRRGQLLGGGEETAAEHLEGQVVCGTWKTYDLQQVTCTAMPQTSVHPGHVHVQELKGPRQIHPGQLRGGKAPTDRSQGERVPRWGSGQPRETVPCPRAVHQGVIRQGRQTLEVRIGTSEQSTKVVVLAEERVEATAHGDGTAVRQDGVPTTEA